MKEKIKSIVIAILVLIIVVGGYSFWNYQKSVNEYRENVNEALNRSIYSSLSVTQRQLVSLRDELKQYDNKQMSIEEFNNIVFKYCWNYFFYGDYTGEFKFINKRFSYLDYSDLSSYLLDLSYEEMSAEDIKYHKDNLMKIAMYWNTLTFKIHEAYYQPSSQLKNTLEKINKLVNQGQNRIDEKQSSN